MIKLKDSTDDDIKLILRELIGTPCKIESVNGKIIKIEYDDNISIDKKNRVNAILQRNNPGLQ